MTKRLLPLAIAWLFAACLAGQSFPGDEVMGTFGFEALPLELTCELAEVPREGFSFQGTFSRNKGQSEAWSHLGGTSREATFDGQVLTSERSAVRQFSECQCESPTTLHEVLAVALVSQSQDRELGGACPENALDGGMPAP